MGPSERAGGGARGADRRYRGGARGADRRHGGGARRARTSSGRVGYVRAAKVAVLGLLALPLLAGCSIQEVIRFGWPEGVTPEATQMRHLWTWSAIAALVVGVITWGAMFWVVVFHRKKKGDDESVPRQTQYNLPVEIVFTVIPTVIVAVLFGFTVAVQQYVDKDVPAAMKIDVTGFQWNWKFAYPEQIAADGKPVETIGTANTIPLLVLPTNTSIEFTIASNDVIHSFYVPEFLFKRDVFPLPEKNDTDNVFVIDRIEQEGAFVGRCAELCGTYHASMNFEVRALNPDLYNRYIALRRLNDPATGVPYSAQQALAQLNCGQWCAPDAITTYPFTDRGQRAAAAQVDDAADPAAVGR